MRTFNNLMIMAFGLLAVILFAAAFENHTLFLYSAMSSLLTAIAFFDGRSIRVQDSDKEET